MSDKLPVADIIGKIQIASYICRDGRTDGFEGWGIKQDLYQIKWAVDEALRKCPTFTPEEDWLKMHEKNLVIKYLKNDL